MDILQLIIWLFGKIIPLIFNKKIKPWWVTRWTRKIEKMHSKTINKYNSYNDIHMQISFSMITDSYFFYMNKLNENNEVREWNIISVELEKIYKNIYKNLKFIKKNSEKYIFEITNSTNPITKHYFIYCFGEEKQNEWKKEVQDFLNLKSWEEKIKSFQDIAYVKVSNKPEKISLSISPKHFKKRIKNNNLPAIDETLPIFE